MADRYVLLTGTSLYVHKLHGVCYVSYVRDLKAALTIDGREEAQKWAKTIGEMEGIPFKVVPADDDPERYPDREYYRYPKNQWCRSSAWNNLRGKIPFHIAKDHNPFVKDHSENYWRYCLPKKYKAPPVFLKEITYT